MTIEITIAGGDWQAIRQQMINLLELEVPGTESVVFTVDRDAIPEPITEEGVDRIIAAVEAAQPPAQDLAVAPPGSKKVEPKKPKIALGRKAMPDAPEAPSVAKEPEKVPEPKPLTPAALIDLRAKTLSELQAAYADGKQKQVFKLLSDLGNGAKSFRELQLEDFPPLRKAIDAGALA